MTAFDKADTLAAMTGGHPSRVLPPGRRLSYWIGEALRDARDSAGVPPKAIAALIDMHDRKIERVEGGEGEEAQSYQDIDRIVAAYAYILGISDPRELWIDALERWFASGGIPDLSEDLPGARFVRPLREEARRQLQARGEPEERLRAIRRKKREAQ